MKRIVIILTIPLVVLIFNGCSVWQAERAWQAEQKFKRARAVYETKKLELESFPDITATVNEADTLRTYRGVIANLSRYRNIKIVIQDKRLDIKKSYFLGRDQRIYDYLKAGDYSVECYYRNRPIGTYELEVKKTYNKSFMGENVYWYLVYEYEGY